MLHKETLEFVLDEIFQRLEVLEQVAKKQGVSDSPFVKGRIYSYNDIKLMLCTILDNLDDEDEN